MANTLLFAQGIAIGKSLCEPDLAETARAILGRAKQAKCRLVLPSDVVVAREFAAHAPSEVAAVERIPPETMALDIGPATVKSISRVLDEARTLVWNGPVGAFETAPFDAGTVALARHVAERTAAGKLLSVAGGGDTVSALAHAGVVDRLSYVSTAGGAFLEWLEGRELPGVAALRID